MAGVMVGLSGLSDCFDGYFARKLDQVTSLGKILDPIADKVTLISVAVCMVIYMPAILPIMMVLVTKEFLMLLGGFILLLCKVAPPPANIFGKVATVIFYFVICLIIFIKILTGQENMLLVYIGLILTAMAMIIALIQYGVVFFRLIKAKNDEKK
jgi:cardiolipin synthase